MPIRRSTYQSTESLESFYKRAEWTGATKIIANKMLELINIINEIFVDTYLIASTSHQRLCIQQDDDEKLSWLIIISNSASDEFHIQYKMPQNKSPWKNAWITGTAKDINEAKIYLIRAMKETGNWKNNSELNNLK